MTAHTRTWAHRRRRIKHLDGEWPFAREVLRFFHRSTVAQERVSSLLAPGPQTLDVASLVPFVGSLLLEIESAVPSVLRDAIARWKKAGSGFWFSELTATLASGGTEGEPPDASVSGLLARILLAPHIMRLPNPPEARAGDEPAATCPTCKWLPLVSVLSEDKDAAAVRRALVCALCARSWSFPRLLCPNCGEERPESLPRYSVEEIPWVRIDACDTCHRYLKVIELPRQPDAEPTTDELASLPLDVIARERGYYKIVPNTLGV